MRDLKLVCLIITIAVGASIADMHAQQQRRAPGRPESKPKVEVFLKAGGQTYQFSGPGRCTYTPTASIYQTQSEMWSAQQAADNRSLALSLWKPKDGSAAMVTLSVASGHTSHEVSTVRGGGAPNGSGKVTVERSGAGARFVLDLKSKDGSPITGTIKCDAFTAHLAEGGP